MIDKKIMARFYFLLNDSTWTTDIIHIPKSILRGTQLENKQLAVDWVYKNIKLHDSVCLIGLYSFCSEDDA